MEAKEYLTQLVFLDCKIKENRGRVQTLKAAAENRTSNLSPNKVQSSGSKDKIGDTVCSYVLIEEMIRQDEEKKKSIIDTISLLKPYESAVIYQCYVNNMSLGEISGSMKRSYSWVAKKHSQGMKVIQAILDAIEAEG